MEVTLHGYVRTILCYLYAVRAYLFLQVPRDQLPRWEEQFWAALHASELSESLSINGLPALSVPPSGEPLHTVWYFPNDASQESGWYINSDSPAFEAHAHVEGFFTPSWQPSVFILDAQLSGVAKVSRLVLSAPQTGALLIEGPSGCGKTALLGYIAKSTPGNHSVRHLLVADSRAMGIHEKCAVLSQPPEGAIMEEEEISYLPITLDPRSLSRLSQSRKP